MSRDALLYVADVVAAGAAILRYVDGVTFEAYAANDAKRGWRSHGRPLILLISTRSSRTRLRWVSARTIKETFSPPLDYRYVYMAEE